MKPEIKKQIILHLPYLAFVYLFGKVGQAFRLAQGADLSAKLLHIGQGFSAAFASAAPSFHPTDLLIGLAAAVIIRLVVYSKQKNAKKYRKGMEYGTARWGTAADIKPFIDPVFDNNVLLTHTERLMMSNRPKDPKNARNKNILVIGGSGSGKTRFFCKPNIMQLHSSYVITDPKGSLICEVGQLLQRAKYRIAVLNTINFSKSMHYNPFAYLRTEKDTGICGRRTSARKTRCKGVLSDVWNIEKNLCFCRQQKGASKKIPVILIPVRAVFSHAVCRPLCSDRRVSI